MRWVDVLQGQHHRSKGGDCRYAPGTALREVGGRRTWVDRTTRVAWSRHVPSRTIVSRPTPHRCRCAPHAATAPLPLYTPRCHRTVAAVPSSRLAHRPLGCTGRYIRYIAQVEYEDAAASVRYMNIRYGELGSTDVGPAPPPGPSPPKPPPSPPPVPPSQCTVKPYAQCGGEGYTGPKCCPSGFECDFRSKYFYQCAVRAAATRRGARPPAERPASKRYGRLRPRAALPPPSPHFFTRAL